MNNRRSLRYWAASGPSGQDRFYSTRQTGQPIQGNCIIPRRYPSNTDCNKAIWVEGFLWALEIPLVKIAILIFYRRIFTGNQRWFKWAFWIMLTYSILWGTATFIIVIVQCVPVPFFWNRAYSFYELDPPDEGSCLQTRPSQVPSALLNCIGDLMLLLLPFPVLWRLQMNLRRKLEIMIIFGLGAL